MLLVFMKMIRNEKENLTLQEAALFYASRTATLWVLLAVSATAVLLLLESPAIALSVGAFVAASGGAVMLMSRSRISEECPLDNPVWIATAPQARPPASEAQRAVSEALIYAYHICARFCAGIAVALCVGGFLFA